MVRPAAGSAAGSPLLPPDECVSGRAAVCAGFTPVGAGITSKPDEVEILTAAGTVAMTVASGLSLPSALFPSYNGCAALRNLLQAAFYVDVFIASFMKAIYALS